MHRVVNDINKRKNNVIVSGLTEVNEASDTEVFQQLFEDHLFCKPTVVSCARLGKPTPDKPRRLLVRVHNEEAVNTLLIKRKEWCTKKWMQRQKENMSFSADVKLRSTRSWRWCHSAAIIVIIYFFVIHFCYFRIILTKCCSTGNYQIVNWSFHWVSPSNWTENTICWLVCEYCTIANNLVMCQVEVAFGIFF